MLKKAMLAAVALIAFLLGVASLLRIHLVRDSADAEMLWNRDQIYLFIQTGKAGYQLSYLRYLADLVKERLGGVTSASDKTFSVVVLRLTPAVTQRNVVDDAYLDFYTPFQTVIYANRQGELWKWTGTEFERATPAETESFEKSMGGLQPTFTNADGWSKNLAVLSRPATYPIQVGGSPFEVIVNRSPDSELSIDLQRPGHPPERIWQLDGRIRKVTKGEYERAFKRT